MKIKNDKGYSRSAGTSLILLIKPHSPFLVFRVQLGPDRWKKVEIPPQEYELKVTVTLDEALADHWGDAPNALEIFTPQGEDADPIRTT